MEVVRSTAGPDCGGSRGCGFQFAGRSGTRSALAPHRAILLSVVKYLPIAAVLLLATTATAGELCVNYVSGTHIEQLESAPYNWLHDCDGGKCAFTSFNPRTRTSLVVAKIEGIPDYIVWDKGFGVLTYKVPSGSYKVPSRAYKLKWRLGAVPTLLPSKVRVVPPFPHPSPPQSQSLGKVWNSFLWDAFAPKRNLDSKPASLTFDAPAHRKIEAGDASGDTYEAFGTPIIWSDTETGEKKVLTQKPVPDGSNGTSHPLAISTADNFILIAEKFSGADAIVADMNTGEVLLRAGDHSRSAGWGKCPSK